MKWVLRTHLCNTVVDATAIEDANSGFIIRDFLDDAGRQFLAELENVDDEDTAPTKQPTTHGGVIGAGGALSGFNAHRPEV